jgi:hypothetical protein
VFGSRNGGEAVAVDEVELDGGASKSVAMVWATPAVAAIVKS